MPNFRHEFFRGDLHAMAGATPRHGYINANVAGTLHSLLRGTPCRTAISDLRVRTQENGLYAYPDVVVACDPVQTAPGDPMSIINPVLIIEVLLPTTERRDRTLKFDQYCLIPSVREILLIAQDSVRVERYTRAVPEWSIGIFQDLDSEVELTSCNCRIKLSDIYERVDFDSDENPGQEA